MKNANRLLTRLRVAQSEDRPSLLSKTEIKCLREAALNIPPPPPPQPCPKPKDQFLVMVFSGALMRDIQSNRNDAQAVAKFAMEIDERKLPPNIHIAAALLLNFFYTNKGCPHKWMLIGLEQEFSKL